MNTELRSMPLSVRLSPEIEARLDQEARRLGISKSEFVKDALQRVLGMKDPATLLKQVRSGQPTGTSDASQDVSQKVRAKLREKHSA